MTWANQQGLIDTTNPYLESYMKIEELSKTVCPICKSIFTDIIAVNHHLVRAHKDEINEEVESILDPLKELRELEVMKRVKNPIIVSTGQFFGDILTSNHNQNVMLNIYGKQGTGKSNAAVDLADATAEYIAKKMGGKPDGHGGICSSDKKAYFCMENVAIMTLKSILPVMRQLDNKRFNIFILDDISGEYNARDSGKKQNKEINNIITTFRDANCMVIITTVSDFLIDKVGRKLAHFQIEMTHSMHSFGLALGKLKIIKEVYQTGDTYYVFPMMHGVQYKKIAFERMSPEMVKQYESRRVEIRKKFTSDSLDKIENGGAIPEKTKPGSKYVEIAPMVNQLMIDHPGMSERAMAKQLNVNPATIKNAVKFIMGAM